MRGEVDQDVVRAVKAAIAGANVETRNEAGLAIAGTFTMDELDVIERLNVERMTEKLTEGLIEVIEEVAKKRKRRAEGGPCFCGHCPDFGRQN